jgi:hypothetical protein
LLGAVIGCKKLKAMDLKFDIEGARTTFNENIKEVYCPKCRFPVSYIQNKSAFEVHERYDDFMNNVEKIHQELIKELQDFFPDTPIKEYFEMKRMDFIEALNLLTKKEERTEVDEIKMNNNFWIKKVRGL